jgi:hypothetical protein
VIDESTMGLAGRVLAAPIEAALKSKINANVEFTIRQLLVDVAKAFLE